MTDTERRALLGDREAQEECTRQGIVLPCPLCGSNGSTFFHIGRYPVCSGYYGECTICHFSTGACKTEKSVLAHWNTRAAPPIGRCVECGGYTSEGPGLGYCSDGTGKTDDGYCDCFYRRKDEHGTVD